MVHSNESIKAQVGLIEYSEAAHRLGRGNSDYHIHCSFLAPPCLIESFDYTNFRRSYPLLDLLVANFNYLSSSNRQYHVMSSEEKFDKIK